MSRRRSEQDEWNGDAFYEAWRRGVPEGRMDYDRMSDAFDNGQSPDGYVGEICRRIEESRQERLAEEYAAEEQAYHKAMEAERYREQEGG